MRATDIVIPYTFSNGQILPAGQLNANNDAILDVVNGGITNGNIDAAAAIALSKLDLTAVAFNKRATGNPTWASGITGDTVARIQLNSDGLLQFGAGSASAVDSSIARLSATLLGARDAANSAYIDFGAANLVANTALKLVNTNTATITPAAMAGNRAVTFLDPLGAADLRCTTGTFNTNGVIYSDSNGLMKSTATGGSGTKVLTSVAGAAPSFSTYSNGFGGDGSDGALTTLAAATFDQYNATTFTLANGTTITPSSGVVLNCTSTCTIGGGASGTITVGTQNAGGPSATSAVGWHNPGSGPAGGRVVSFDIGGFGGGGGGCGGAGGIGSVPTDLITSGVPGGPAIYNSGGAGLVGSGGASGAYSGSGSTGGAGGAGGGRFVICALDAISVASGATISAVGAAGTAGTAATGAGRDGSGGGGGGSGGVVILASQTSTSVAGTVTVAGGAGGNGGAASGGDAGGGGGGGGGGGIVIRWSPSNSASGTVTVSGGAAGTVGGTPSAAAGSTGVNVAVTGTPNLPLLGKIQDDIRPLMRLAHVKELHNREVAALYAKDSAEYLHLCSGSLTETCEAIGDIDALSNAG